MTELTTSNGWRVSRRNLWVLTAAAGLLCVAGLFTLNELRKREILGIPASERQQLYEHALATLQAPCESSASEKLREYCQQQATLLARLPECQAACQKLCQRYLPQPSK